MRLVQFCEQIARFAAVPERLSESAQDGMPRGNKLGTVRKGQAAHDCLPAAGDAQQNFPPVISAAHAFEQAVEFEPIDEFYRAVVMDLQPFGEQAHGRRATVGQAFNGQQCLKLLRLDTGIARRLLGQIQKTSEFVTELRERTIIELRLHLRRLMRVIIS